MTLPPTMPVAGRASSRRPQQEGTFTNTSFEGDRRKKVLPIHAPPQTYPIPVRRRSAQTQIRAMLSAGQSGFHSSNGLTVWVPIAFCIEKGLDYTLLGSPSEGYVVVLNQKEGQEPDTPSKPTAQEGSV